MSKVGAAGNPRSLPVLRPPLAPEEAVALQDVPVDAAGNMEDSFVEALLEPKHPVATALFDDSHASGLSDFARLGLRILGHDLIDGQVNGDVVFRALLAPGESANEALVSTPEKEDMVREWGRMDRVDNGRIDGSVYGALLEKVWPVTDGNPLKNFARRLHYREAPHGAAEMYRTLPRMESPDSVEKWMNATGMSAVELLSFSLWGHRILDRAVGTQILAQKAAEDPTAIDFPLAHFNEETLAYVKEMSQRPHADIALGADVLKLLKQHLDRTPKL